MGAQGILVLLLAVGALAWLVRHSLKGSCASGCGGCQRACPARRLQEAPRKRP